MVGAGSAKAGGRSHWGITAALIVADVIGGGVLALPGTFASLGWIGGISALLLLGYVSLYTGQLKAASTASQMFGLCVVFLVGMTIFTNQAAESVQMHSVCFVKSAGVLSVVVLLFAQVRDMHGVGQMAVWISAPTLYFALALFFYELFGSPEHETKTNMWPPFGSEKTTVALMSIVLTYAGHVVYFELIADMKQPEDFEKAVVSSQAVIMVTYFVVSIAVYLVLGSGVASPFQVSLPASSPVGVANFLMILHVLVSLILNHHVISKLLFDFAASSLSRAKGGTAIDGTPLGSPVMRGAGWLLATAAVTAAAWLTANLVPFFSDIMALLSSIAAVNLTYGFPAAAALLQHRREMQLCSNREVVSKVAELESGTTADESNMKPESDSLERPSRRVFAHPCIEVPFCWLIVIFSATMMVYGTFNAVEDTIATWASSRDVLLDVEVAS
eukprot:CAMPEP_0115663276 /NCGR_PEP_ID=MMETSP0272-20121206/47757_1 /TAXON_ID=71861 /ORGANISM="Scrippsiella trochoidea, Strain CCMP3099" /LENGTH=444 /DNA_ID=CAMNT_0003101619 /DNA_START=24 /DNA_END=1360 /DNA_ORIENTATION=-